jgi:hypothetical protein
MKKVLLTTISIFVGIVAFAQNSTIITPSTSCRVFRNFNSADEGFNSPSIYSNANDVSFNWNAIAGAEVENSGLSIRSASLISPVYIQTEPGVATVGFKYSAPAGSFYRVRIISAVISSLLEVLATTANGPVYTPLSDTAGNICLLITDADLTVGKQFRIEFTFALSQPGNVTFDDLALSVAAGPLPVLFQGFVARKNTDGTLKLLWNVGQEINVKGYYLQSSTNGIDFIDAGYVSASNKAVYSLDYKDKIAELMFFKVKNEDLDGSFKFTPIIKVFEKNQTDPHIQLYPIPANNVVTIQHNAASQNATVTLYSTTGKILQQVRSAPLTFQTQLKVNNLSKGVYIIKYNDGQALPQAVMMIKN